MKTTTKRVLAAFGTALLIVAMIVASGLTGIGGRSVKAEELHEGTEGAAKTITIISPDGLGSSDSVTYTVYKVFNATSDGSSDKVSYSLPNGSGLNLPLEADDQLSKFDKDSSGNIHYYSRTTTNDNYVEDTTTAQLSDSMIQKLSGETSNFTNIGTVTITGGKTKKTVNVPDYGYYFITTTTGSVVNITTTNPKASITDKNTGPTVNKKIINADSVEDSGKNALASIGSTVKFQSEITIGKGAKGYVYHDTMGSGLNYNNDVTIYKNIINEGNKVSKSDYTTLTPENQTFAVSFSNDYIKTLSTGDKLIVVYTATVTDSALQTEKDAGKNTAYVAYGNDSEYSTEPDSTHVYNAKLTVTKKADSETGSGLAGAGFILQRTTDNKYYKYIAASENKSAKIEWVDNESDATQYYSHSDGKLYASTETTDDIEKSFEGLANGEYKLIEKTVPSGYNKADDKTFTINGTNETAWNGTANLEKEMIVVNRAGSLLPGTGGIGTLIFYIVGAAIVVAAVTLIVKRRKDQQKDA